MYIAGHLTIKKGRYYAVLSYNYLLGKRHEKWVATGLPVKGNKKRAEEFLMNLRRDFVRPEPQTPEEDMTFAEFCRLYLSCGRKMMLRVGRANEKSPLREQKGPPQNPWILWGKGGKRSVAFSRSTSLGDDDCLGRLAGKQSHLCAE